MALDFYDGKTLLDLYHIRLHFIEPEVDPTEVPAQVIQYTLVGIVCHDRVLMDDCVLYTQNYH